MERSVSEMQSRVFLSLVGLAPLLGLAPMNRRQRSGDGVGCADRSSGRLGGASVIQLDEHEWIDWLVAWWLVLREALSCGFCRQAQ
jgi:hypothetical protein